MTQKDLFPTVTSSQQDTPVRRSALQVDKKALKMTATSGRTSLELLHTKDPLGAVSKMFMVTSEWDSTRCCTTWKAKATPQGRLLFQLVASVRDTKGTDSGLSQEMWATPRVGGEENFESLQKRKGTKVAKSTGGNLLAQVQYRQDQTMWPTPDANCGDRGTQKEFQKIRPNGQPAQYTINQAVRDNPQMWSTPTATMYKGSGSNSTVRSRLDYDVEKPNGVRVVGHLSPNWVEWLMGYPRGWTDLTDGAQSQKTSQD